MFLGLLHLTVVLLVEDCCEVHIYLHQRSYSNCSVIMSINFVVIYSVLVESAFTARRFG